MNTYKVAFSYQEDDGTRTQTSEVFCAKNCQGAADLAFANKSHLGDLSIDGIWKETATHDWMAVNAWTQPRRAVTSFERLCLGLGVDPRSEAAEVVSQLVNGLIFSDSREYTDDEIIATVNGLIGKWEARAKQAESNQGFTIIAAEAYSAKFRIVLGYKTTSLGPAYVTWESGTRADGTFDYFWGHYFGNEREARMDFHRRLFDHYEQEG